MIVTMKVREASGGGAVRRGAVVKRLKAAASTTAGAALYLRVSTEEQAEHGVSLDAQRERGLAYCKLQNLIVEPEHIYVDDGVSAGKPLSTRPRGAELLAAIKRGDVGHVTAVKLDRLFRDAIDCLTVARDWEKQGVAMHLLDLGGQTVNTRTAMGSFFLLVMAGCAEMERGLIRERTRTALQLKKARGDRLGATPLGFITPRPGAPMQQVEAELAIVRLILKLRRRNPSRWTFRQIAARLEREGRQTKRGGAWAAATVKRVWDRRQFYTRVGRHTAT